MIGRNKRERIVIDSQLEGRGSLSVPLEPQPEITPHTVWDFDVTQSQIVGAGAVMGVYGEKVQQDEGLIRRALDDELAVEEIAELQELRGIGEQYRFGPDGELRRVE